MIKQVTAHLSEEEDPSVNKNSLGEWDIPKFTNKKIF
jgi:hypothetical protein